LNPPPQPTKALPTWAIALIAIAALLLLLIAALALFFFLRRRRRVERATEVEDKGVWLGGANEEKLLGRNGPERV